MGFAEFSVITKTALAQRAGGRCSLCRAATSGPADTVKGYLVVGEAAHITADALGGPRYDASLAEEERRSLDNGVWLCANCHTRVDRDPARYTSESLRRIKEQAERQADSELGRPAPVVVGRGSDARSAALDTLVDAVSSRFAELAELRNITDQEYDDRMLPEALESGGGALYRATHGALPYLSEPSQKAVLALQKSMDFVALAVGVRPTRGSRYDPHRVQHEEAQWDRLNGAYDEYLKRIPAEIAGTREETTAATSGAASRAVVSLRELASQFEGFGSVLVRLGPSGPEDRNPRMAKIRRLTESIRNLAPELSTILGALGCETLLSELDEAEHSVITPLFERVAREWELPESRGRLGDPQWRQAFWAAERQLAAGAASMRSIADRIQGAVDPNASLGPIAHNPKPPDSAGQERTPAGE